MKQDDMGTNALCFDIKSVFKDISSMEDRKDFWISFSSEGTEVHNLQKDIFIKNGLKFNDNRNFYFVRREDFIFLYSLRKGCDLPVEVASCNSCLFFFNKEKFMVMSVVADSIFNYYEGIFNCCCPTSMIYSNFDVDMGWPVTFWSDEN